MTEIAIGIDPGTNTGFAVWNITEQRFESISCLKIHQALDEVFLANNKDKITVVFEDALAGEQAGNAAGMITVGIGEPEILDEADFVMSGFENFELKELKSRLNLS